jgi:energy-coupling factor transport system permease protein
MSLLRRPDDELAYGSPLGRLSPILKLGIALAWLIGLLTTTDPRPPLMLALVAVVAGMALGGIPIGRLARGLAPLWSVALLAGFFNAIFSAANPDPASTELLTLGPLRMTEEGVEGGVGIGARVLGFAAVGGVFGLTTDPTRFVDSLVQQARLPARFAYGALAAYGAIPRFAEDLTTLRQARRIRGLRSSWHPGLLLALLVLAIRHADRMALAMDARAFGSGPRTAFREVRWTWGDGVAIPVAIAILAIVLRIVGEAD